MGVWKQERQEKGELNLGDTKVTSQQTLHKLWKKQFLIHIQTEPSNAAGFSSHPVLKHCPSAGYSHSSSESNYRGTALPQYSTYYILRPYGASLHRAHPVINLNQPDDSRWSAFEERIVFRHIYLSLVQLLSESLKVIRRCVTRKRVRDHQRAGTRDTQGRIPILDAETRHIRLGSAKMSSQVQNLSFRRPTNEPKTPKAALAARHTGILQDQLRRYNSTVKPVSSCLSPMQSSTTTMGSILLARCAPSLPSTDIWCDVLQHQRLRRRSEHNSIRCHGTHTI
jgi:hypothetical protein